MLRRFQILSAFVAFIFLLNLLCLPLLSPLKRAQAVAPLAIPISYEAVVAALALALAAGVITTSQHDEMKQQLNELSNRLIDATGETAKQLGNQVIELMEKITGMQKNREQEICKNPSGAARALELEQEKTRLARCDFGPSHTGGSKCCEDFALSKYFQDKGYQVKRISTGASMTFRVAYKDSSGHDKACFLQMDNAHGDHFEVFHSDKADLRHEKYGHCKHGGRRYCTDLNNDICANTGGANGPSVNLPHLDHLPRGIHGCK